MGLSRINFLKKCYLVLFFLLPFIVFLPLYNPYELPKFLIFTISIIVSFFVYLFLRILRKYETIFTLDRKSVIIVLYGAWVFFTLLIGLSFPISFLGSSYRHQGFVLLFSCIVYYFFLKHIFSLKPKTALLSFFSTGMILTTLLLAGIAVWQAIMLFVLHSPFIATYQGRIVGTFGNPNFLAGYLAMCLPFLLWPVAPHRHFFFIPFRWVQVCTTLLLLLAVVFTNSRSGFLAIGFITLVFFIKKKLYWVFAAIIAIATIYIVGNIFSGSITSQLRHINRYSYWDNRQSLWTYGIQAVIQRPLFGYGLENFELLYPKEKKLKVDNAHNIFLEVVVASGIPGLTLFLLLLFFSYKQARFVVKISLLAFLITAQFNPLSIPQIVFFWLLLAFPKEKEIPQVKDNNI